MRFHKKHSKELETLVFNFREAIETAKANNETGDFLEISQQGSVEIQAEFCQYLIDSPHAAIRKIFRFS